MANVLLQHLHGASASLGFIGLIYAGVVAVTASVAVFGRTQERRVDARKTLKILLRGK